MSDLAKLFDSHPSIDKAGRLPGDRGLSWLSLAADAPDNEGAGADLEPEETEFVSSSGVIDRHSDFVEQTTWKYDRYKRNPVMLYEHRAPVVGRATKTWKARDAEGNWQLRQRFVFDAHESNPTGMLVAHQHKNGFRKAVSVGFIPGEIISRTELPPDDPRWVNPGDKSKWSAGFVFRHNELLETSSVAVPANHEALQAASLVAEAESTDSAIDRYLGETLPKAVRDIVADAIRSDVEIRRSLLGIIRADAVADKINNQQKGSIAHFFGG